MDKVARDRPEIVTKAPLVFEAMAKGGTIERVAEAGENAAGEVNATACTQRQGEITGNRT